jgi:hypothetical protein
MHVDAVPALRGQRDRERDGLAKLDGNGAVGTKGSVIEGEERVDFARRRVVPS